MAARASASIKARPGDICNDYGDIRTMEGVCQTGRVWVTPLQALRAMKFGWEPISDGASKELVIIEREGVRPRRWHPVD